MYLDGERLFIADVNKVMVYDLNTPTQPQTLQMPEGDLFVNDMAAADGTLYFAGRGGVVSFRPEAFYQKPAAPRLLARQSRPANTGTYR